MATREKFDQTSDLLASQIVNFMALRERLRLASFPRLVARALGRSADSIAIPRERLPLALRERVAVSAKNRAFETALDFLRVVPTCLHV